MSYFIVNTVVDSVDPSDSRLSLREALILANASGGGDTIRFSAKVVGRTLVLTGGELVVTTDVTIDGNNGGAAARTMIDAARASRVLRITGGGTEAKLNGLILTNGRSNDEPGGGILVDGRASLAMTDSTVTRNDTVGDSGYGADGGGIFVDSAASLTLDHASVSDNSTGGLFHYGGGIAAYSSQITIRNSAIAGNVGREGGGLGAARGSIVSIENTNFTGNYAFARYHDASGGAVFSADSTATISRSSIVDNHSRGSGGGIISITGNMTISDSTVSSNRAGYTDNDFYNRGGGIWASGYLVIRNTTITGNSAGEAASGASSGGGIHVVLGTFEIANSVVAGNFAKGSAGEGPDIFSESIGGSFVSNGRNVFGSAVVGSVPGDRANIAPAAVFAAIDPATGGGRLRADGTVALRNDVASPALSAGDPLAANIFDQRGAVRPQPAGSLPDLGAVELDQPLSTGASANNDVRSGSAAANNLSGRAGNDYLKGLAGKDTMDGGNGSDLLDGGSGNDKLTGGTGLDLVAYPGAAAVIIDLGGTSDTARRGGETDQLAGIEGALGSSGADRFTGDALANEFQGKAGKDTMTGGPGRDTWDFNDVADSPAGATRDLVTDFAPGQDVLDLAGIDADATVPGNQSFRWVAKATLTGAAQLGWFATGGMTVVRASTDRDAAPELEIQLTGRKVLSETDFRP